MCNFHYKHYLLVLLIVVGVFNLLDRHVLALAMEPLKQEFQLSDGQLGLLSGLAFSLFYAVAGIPIARWADRGNRNVIVALTTGLWSVMVVLCGMAGNFAQLLLTRVGVAIGEAGCVPTVQSLIPDYFDRAERPRAMAIYWLCGPLAIILGYLGGGWLIEYLGWRNTFIVMGVPGIFLALLAKLTLREPRLADKNRAVESPLSFKGELTALWRQRTFRNITMAFILMYFFSAGYSQWLPAFFIRSHGMGIGELGTWFALTWGIGGLFGTFLGGMLATRYMANNEPLQMRACTLVFSLCGLLYIMVFLSSNLYHAITYMATAGVLQSMCNGVIFSSIQSVVNAQMRSIAFAFIFLLANLIGHGLGPIGAGLLSDLLAPSFGQASLRYALATFSPGLLLAGYYFWQAAGTIEGDIRAVESKADLAAGITPALGTQDKQQYTVFDVQ